jgi:hypothetical protein
LSQADIVALTKETENLIDGDALGLQRLWRGEAKLRNQIV